MTEPSKRQRYWKSAIAITVGCVVVAVANWRILGPRGLLALLVVGLIGAAYEYAASRRVRR